MPAAAIAGGVDNAKKKSNIRRGRLFFFQLVIFSRFFELYYSDISIFGE
jgi:hypothetical protein